MDESTQKFLTDMKMEEVVIIPLAELENDEIRRIKPTRNFTEYCWTLTPAVIRYCLERHQLPECTYLDADLYFFESPDLLLSEVKKASRDVLITPHNFTRIFDQTKGSGKYCVQFVYFKNSHRARALLEKWYRQCLEWCYDRVEEGRFGDQKYLDSWPEDYPDVVWVQKHEGIGAPWNIQRYLVREEGHKILIQRGREEFPLVFYHFHGLKRNQDGTYTFGPYPFSAAVREKIYRRYLEALKENRIEIEASRAPMRRRTKFKLWVYERLYWFLRY
jgi:hypothetical protein